MGVTRGGKPCYRPAVARLRAEDYVVATHGARAVRRLFREVAKHAARLLVTLPCTAPEARDEVESVRAHLADALKARPDAALAALASVDVVGPLFMCDAGGLATGPGLARAAEALFVQLAARGCIAAGSTHPARHGRAFDDARGLRLTPSAKRWTSDALQRPEGQHDATYPQLVDTDTNPRWQVQDHPEARANALSLGGSPAHEWQRRLGDAMERIYASLPEIHAELPHTARRLVPVGVLDEAHHSASFRDLPGQVYLTLHPDALVMAEALIHEAQHGKLHALDRCLPLMRNGRAGWSPSPVRPDLRPLFGLLLAAHAFVPIALCYGRMVEAQIAPPDPTRFELRYGAVLAGNATAMRTLRERAEWTDAGAALFARLSALHEETRDAAPRWALEGARADALPPG